jgi:uncharacterized membrane protein YfcA
LRRIITGVVLLSGLKYVGVPTTALGVVAVAVAVTIAFITLQHWRRAQRETDYGRLLVPEPVEDVITLLPTGFDRDL